MLADIIAELESRGHRAAAVRADRIEDLRETYRDLQLRGALDEGFAKLALGGLSFESPDGMSATGSLIVIATRDPIVSCTFRRHGSEVILPVPPTYLHGARKNREIVGLLADIIPGNGHAPSVNVPKKLLAVRSGLAAYGRNNITYVPGFGSFFRLAAVWTDLPCESDDWCEASMLPRCESCSLCISGCPTGAIPEERFLLKAERCITYWNEQPANVSFPEWLESDWHDCVVGCLHCQLVCPENQAVLDYEEPGPIFTEVETEALLSAGPAATLPTGLEEKLRRWDLLDWLAVLPRNLAVHLSDR